MEVTIWKVPQLQRQCSVLALTLHVEFVIVKNHISMMSLRSRHQIPIYAITLPLENCLQFEAVARILPMTLGP